MQAAFPKTSYVHEARSEREELAGGGVAAERGYQGLQLSLWGAFQRALRVMERQNEFEGAANTSPQVTKARRRKKMGGWEALFQEIEG